MTKKKLPQKTTKKLTLTQQRVVDSNKDLPKYIRTELQKLGLILDVRKGDHVIGERGYEYTVAKLSKAGVRLTEDKGDGTDSHYGTIEFREWGNRRFIKIDKPLDEIEEETLDYLKEHKSDEDDEDSENIEESTSTALTTVDKNYLLHQEEALQHKRDKFAIMERILNKRRNQLQSIVSDFKEQIVKVQRVIGQIELYLGINEDIVQIQDGSPASVDTPISFRQQILYMDEEYGSYENQGLDYQDIEQFDDWLLKDQKYKEMLPEEKGVIVFRVRRGDKEYDSNAFVNSMMNAPNRYTYLLIRNGDKIYRILANVIIHGKLFPNKDEMQNVINDKGGYYFGGKEEHIESMIFTYGQNLILLQGLMDRSQVFQPMPHGVNLLKVETYGKIINLIYDDDLKITDGHAYYKDWKEKINSKIKVGTRIFFVGFPSGACSRDNIYHRFPFNPPDYPEEGVYSVKRIEKDSSYYANKDAIRLVCHFNPKDTVYAGWYSDSHERKQSIPFYISPDEWFVLNYDLMSLEDVEYYIKSRIEREKYLEVLPTLWGIKKRRIKELKVEKGMVEAFTLRYNCDEKLVWKAINWWKHKVIWKRPITKDDSKAYRMISARIKRLKKEAKKK